MSSPDHSVMMSRWWKNVVFFFFMESRCEKWQHLTFINIFPGVMRCFFGTVIKPLRPFSDTASPVHAHISCCDWPPVQRWEEPGPHFMLIKKSEPVFWEMIWCLHLSHALSSPGFLSYKWPSGASVKLMWFPKLYSATATFSFPSNGLGEPTLNFQVPFFGCLFFLIDMCWLSN